MRIMSILFGLIVLLSTANSGSVHEAASEGDRIEIAVGPVSTVQQSPPSIFVPFRTPWDHVVVMPEEQSLVVGQLLVYCGADTTDAPVFELLPPTPSFVSIVPDYCSCPNLNIQRALVVVFPRRGDKGTYTVLGGAGGCGGVGQQFGFTLKVKKAPQE